MNFFTQIPQATHSLYHFRGVRMTADVWPKFSNSVFVLSIITLLVSGKGQKRLGFFSLGT